MKRCRCKLEDSTEMEFGKVGFECGNWIEVKCSVKQVYQGLTLDGWWWCFVHQSWTSCAMKTATFLKITVFWEVTHCSCFTVSPQNSSISLSIVLFDISWYNPLILFKLFRNHILLLPTLKPWVIHLCLYWSFTQIVLEKMLFENNIQTYSSITRSIYSIT
jgi:hypothetical protein